MPCELLSKRASSTPSVTNTKHFQEIEKLTDTLPPCPNARRPLLTSHRTNTQRQRSIETHEPIFFDQALDDKTLKCWGGNERGSLGLGDIVNRGALSGEMGDNLNPVALTFGSAGGDVSNVFAGR